MSILDAFALVAFLVDEPGREEVEQLLRGRQGKPRIASVSLLQVYDILCRVRGVELEVLDEKISRLVKAGLDVAPLERGLAGSAAELRCGHYDRRRRPVSVPDCVAAATARAGKEPLATADPTLQDLCRAIGVDVIRLPDSGGRRR